MKEKKKRKVSQSWKISRKTTVNININPQTVETFPLFNLQPFPDTSSPSSFPSLFTLIHLCSSLSSCFLLFHVFFPRTYTSHSTSLLTLISMPSSISFEKFHDIFVQEKKKNLICSSHLRYSVSFSSLLCHWLPFTFQCSLIQFYDKMETALTKATKNLLIPTLSYLCSLLILQERLLHFGHSTFLCAFKVFSSL